MFLAHKYLSTDEVSTINVMAELQSFFIYAPVPHPPLYSHALPITLDWINIEILFELSTGLLIMTNS